MAKNDKDNYKFLFTKPVDPKNLAGEPVFDHELLERITVTSPFIALISNLPLATFAVIIGILKNSMTATMSIALWIGGFCFWSLVEYLIHRFFYHRYSSHPFVRKVQFLFHGFHHKHPSDKYHLFMPFFGGWPVAFFSWVLMYILMGAYSFLFFSGFWSGYMFYVFTHYYIHRFPPPFRFLRPLWRHHLLHHYKYPDRAFGFTTTLWDRLFGTLPPKAS